MEPPKGIASEVWELLQASNLLEKDAYLLTNLKPLTEADQLIVVNKVLTGEAVNSLEAKRQLIRERTVIMPMPEGTFDVIYADPPWRYEFNKTKNRAIENHYPTLSLEEIKQLPVPSADNAVLFLWATAPKLEEALDVMRAWGFKYRTCVVWDKETMGMGNWFRIQHELLLLGVKGKMKVPPVEARVRSVYREKRGKHSQKPRYFYEVIEKMFPNGKYLELFARQRYNDKWTVWGNQL